MQNSILDEDVISETSSNTAIPKIQHIIHHIVPKTKTSERRSTDADIGPITSVLKYHFFLTFV
jgi:hypothetical protein